MLLMMMMMMMMMIHFFSFYISVGGVGGLSEHIVTTVAVCLSNPNPYGLRLTFKLLHMSSRSLLRRRQTQTQGMCLDAMECSVQTNRAPRQRSRALVICPPCLHPSTGR